MNRNARDFTKYSAKGNTLLTLEPKAVGELFKLRDDTIRIPALRQQAAEITCHRVQLGQEAQHGLPTG